MSRTADKDKKKDKGVQKRTTDKDKPANSPPSSPHIELKKSNRKQRADIVRTPIFGNPLADEIARSQARFGKELLVPDFLYFSAKFLESLGLNQVGLFRIAGEKNACNALKDKMLDGFDYTFEGESEHTVCTLFKQYLRSLPVPLCTFDYFDEFCYLSKCDDDDERVSHIQEYINDTIPKENAVVLKFVIRFLKKVGQNSSKNQMTVSNLSSMVAPNILFREKEIQSKMLSDTKDSNFCVEFLINQYDKVFKAIPDQKEFEIVDSFLEPEKVESGGVKEKRDKPPKRQSTKDDKHKDKTDRDKDRKTELTDSTTNAAVTTADSPKPQATGDDATPPLDSPSTGKLPRNPTSPRRQHSKGDRGDKIAKLKNSDAVTSSASEPKVEKPATAVVEPAPEIENVAVTPIVEQPQPKPEPTPEPPKVEPPVVVAPSPVVPEPEPKKVEPAPEVVQPVVAKPVEEPKKVEKAASVNATAPTAVKSPRTPKDNSGNVNANATKPATQPVQPQPVTSTKSLNPTTNATVTATPSPTPQPVVEAKPPSTNGASNNASSGGPALTSTQEQHQKDKEKEKEVLANLPRTASLIEKFQQFQKEPEQPEIKHVAHPPQHATTPTKFGGGANATTAQTNANSGNTTSKSTLNVPTATPTPSANPTSNGANSAPTAANDPLTPRAQDRINQYQSHTQDKAHPVLNVDNPVGQAEEDERISKDKFNQLRAMFNQPEKKDEDEEERLKREKFNQLRAMFNK